MKTTETKQLSQATIDLANELKALGLAVKMDEPENIAVYYENNSDRAIIKWSDIMYPILKKNVKELDLSTLARDGVRLLRTWNWGG